MNVVQGLIDAAASIVSTTLTWFVNAVWNNPEAVKYGIAFAGFAAVFVFVLATIMTVKWLYRKAMAGYRELSFRAKRSWYWLMKRPRVRTMKGKIMAKWKNGYMADRFEETIFQAQLDHVLSDQEAKRLRKAMGKATGFSDLIPRMVGKEYLIRYFKGGKDKHGNVVPPIYQKLAGPKDGATLPGPKPGEDVPVAPPTNVVNSAMLAKIREKKQQAA